MEPEQEIDGVLYILTESSEDIACEGCVGIENSDLCKKLGGECCYPGNDTKCWVKKEN